MTRRLLFSLACTLGVCLLVAQDLGLWQGFLVAGLAAWVGADVYDWIFGTRT